MTAIPYTIMLSVLNEKKIVLQTALYILVYSA